MEASINISSSSSSLNESIESGNHAEVRTSRRPSFSFCRAPFMTESVATLAST